MAAKSLMTGIDECLLNSLLLSTAWMFSTTTTNSALYRNTTSQMHRCLIHSKAHLSSSATYLKRPRQNYSACTPMLQSPRRSWKRPPSSPTSSKSGFRIRVQVLSSRTRINSFPTALPSSLPSSRRHSTSLSWASSSRSTTSKA